MMSKSPAPLTPQVWGRAVSFSPKIDGEMGRWGDGENNGANTRDFGQIYLTFLEGR
ncbi:MAG: hypothetical protein F6K56_32115 [Moorea sp. SIO3G5]|nr:hypothetical protein [Moorena sp. SIO3G5]